MKELIEFLRGKKTYIVALLVLIIVICEKVLGIDIPGAEVANPFDYILAALGISALRAGVAKTG